MLTLLNHTKEKRKETQENDRGNRTTSMVDFVNKLREKLKVDRKIYSIVFGSHQLKKVKQMEQQLQGISR